MNTCSVFIIMNGSLKISLPRFQEWMPKVRRIDANTNKTSFLVIKSVWEMQEPDVMKELSSSFACGKDDEGFCLEKLNIAPAESTALFKFLSHIKNLKQLKIRCCTMTNIAIRELAEFLKTYNHALDLKGDNCKLTELEVSFNNLTDESAKYLSDALKSANCKLTELDVSGNELTDEGAKYLSDALKSASCKLTELDVSGNELTDEGAKYLSDALKSASCKLTEL